MFDEEIGHSSTRQLLKLPRERGAPLMCYPCDNFRPLETANHQQYLDIAERKLATNTQSGSPCKHTTNKESHFIHQNDHDPL